MITRMKARPHRRANFDFLISLKYCYALNGHLIFDRVRSGRHICIRSAKLMIQNCLGPLHWSQLIFARLWSICAMDLLLLPHTG